MLQVRAVGHRDIDGTGIVVDDDITDFNRQMVCACQVKVTDVKVLNQRAKETTRGTRYQGRISGFKKAVVTVAEGEAIDLFKE